jgi:hypothetical protein
VGSYSFCDRRNTQRFIYASPDTPRYVQKIYPCLRLLKPEDDVVSIVNSRTPPPRSTHFRLLNGQLGSCAPYLLPLQWDWGSRGMETYGLGYAAGSSGVLFSREQSGRGSFSAPAAALLFVLFLSMEAGQPAVGLSVAFREKWGTRWPSFRPGGGNSR